MSRILAGARPASALASLIVTAAVVSGSASAQDGPVLLTGLLPLGTAIDAAPSAQLQLAANPASDATVPQAAPASAGGGLSLDVDVIAKELDIARQQIEPSLGASVYNFGRQAIATQPQGDNQPLNRLLLQAPGVAQDSFGQIHVRGDHANLQYRLNGIILPEGINVFGQVLQTRLAQSVSLITGALPAEYGLRTAGIIDIQTKTGTLDPGGDVHPLRRPAIDISTERGIRRHGRSGRLFRDRRSPARCRRDREPGSDFQRHPRHLDAAARLCLCLRYHRPDDTSQLDFRRLAQ